MEIYFREAPLEKLDAILGMMKDFSAIDNYAFNREERKENLFRFTASKEMGRLWTIYADELMVGYAVLAFGFSFEFGGRDAFIDELYITESYRNKGIGGKTLEFIFANAPALGIKAIYLEVEKHNEKGNVLYVKKGFKDHNRHLMTRSI
jgi:diamine N-acetyltransferase